MTRLLPDERHNGSESLFPAQIWLDLFELPDGARSSIGIDYAEALRLDRKGFVRLYRTHVLGASKREAKQWADRQIEAREAGKLGG